MEYIKRFIWGVANEAFIGNIEVIGCTDKEIQNIKNNAKQKGLCLPKAYLEFLTFGGHEVGQC